MKSRSLLLIALAIAVITTGCGEKKPDSKILPVITQTMLKSLDKDFNIKLYLSGDAPEPLSSMRLFFDNLFYEMYRCSNKFFDFVIIDPDSSETVAEETRKQGVAPFQLNIRENNSERIKMMYASLVMQYDGRKEIIDVSLYSNSMRLIVYDIALSMASIMSDTKRKIGFLQGHDEATLENDLTKLKEKLEMRYVLEDVNIDEDPKKLADLDVLCIINPKSKIPESHRYAIDQFLMKGGRLLLAINKMNVDIAKMTLEISDLDIDGWTKSYGFVIKDEIAIDKSARTVPFQVKGGFGRQITMCLYPPFIDISRFKEDFCPIYKLENVELAFSSPVEEITSPSDSTISKMRLMWTSDSAGSITESEQLNPIKAEYTYDRSGITLSLMLIGRFRSAWEGKQLPDNVEVLKSIFGDSTKESANTAIFVIGDGNSIQDKFMAADYHNLDLFAGIIDWLAFFNEVEDIQPLNDEQLTLLQRESQLKEAVKYLK